jgi:hypothetical protein
VHRIFPNLSAKDAKYASTIITKFMRTVVGKVQGLHKDTTSKDLRYGSMNTTYVHPEGGSEITAAIGGWGQDIINIGTKTGAMANYLTCLSILICQASSILSGYKHSARVYQAPKCHFINNENKQQIFNFLSAVLFLHKRHKKFDPQDGDMKMVTLTSFAIYLMWLDKVRVIKYFFHSHPKLLYMFYIVSCKPSHLSTSCFCLPDGPRIPYYSGSVIEME